MTIKVSKHIHAKPKYFLLKTLHKYYPYPEEVYVLNEINISEAGLRA